MGGRGSSSGRGAKGGGKTATSFQRDLNNRLAGNQIELDYAKMKVHEYGNIKYGGTTKSREMFYQWSDEVRRLNSERQRLETAKEGVSALEKQLKNKTGEIFSKPKYSMDSKGNVSFLYTGTKQFSQPKGGKIQSQKKNDIVERITEYTGTIFIGQGTRKIIRKSKTKSENIIKRGKL